MKTLFKITLFCLLFTPINAFAQFKHDLGIKGTNLDTERLQLEYRLHKNENWAFTGTFGYAGSGYRTSYAEGLLPGDTTYQTIYNMYQRSFYSLSVGGLRKFSFMKHNFYYAGATIGARFENYNSSTNISVYDLDSSFSPSYWYGYYAAPFEPGTSEYNYSALAMTSKLYVGANVPIVDRLSFTVEGGFNYSLEARTNYFRSSLAFYTSFGLRYNFGRLE